MKVSVCIPHYGSETFLDRALESVAAQTLQPYEVVVSLDSDVSDTLQSKFRTRMAIRWLRNASPGLPSNWNNVLSAAAGDFIVLLHSDDVLEDSYLQVISALIQIKPHSHAWFCGAEEIDSREEPLGSLSAFVKKCLMPPGRVFELKGDEGLASLLRGCFIYCPTVCYDRDMLQRLRFDERWSMVVDLDLYHRVLTSGYSITGTTRLAYKYRRHKRSATYFKSRDLTRYEEEWDLYQEIEDTLSDKDFRSSKRVARWKVILWLHLASEVVIASIRFDFTRTRKLISFAFSR